MKKEKKEEKGVKNSGKPKFGKNVKTREKE